MCEPPARQRRRRDRREPGPAGQVGFFRHRPELRRRFGVLEPIEAVTEAELRAAIEATFDRRSSPPSDETRDAYAQLEPPELEPRFRSLLVGDEGWLWAETFQLSPDAPSTWLLFDPLGRGRGSVVTPPGLRVMSISRDFVAGVWRDDFEVEYVGLYGIEGRA